MNAHVTNRSVSLSSYLRCTLGTTARRSSNGWLTIFAESLMRALGGLSV